MHGVPFVFGVNFTRFWVAKLDTPIVFCGGFLCCFGVENDQYEIPPY